jgi:hypothetical protein
MLTAGEGADASGAVALLAAEVGTAGAALLPAAVICGCGELLACCCCCSSGPAGSSTQPSVKQGMHLNKKHMWLALFAWQLQELMLHCHIAPP